jgi:glutamate-ammonia-ligase adenylyltransferase
LLQNPTNSPAQSALRHVEHFIPPDLRQGLEILLSQSADPSAALQRLESFCEQSPSEFQHLAYMPFGLQALVALFSSSHFLSEAALHHPDWLLGVLETGWLHRVRTKAEMEAELEDWLGAANGLPDPLMLSQFRRRHVLRILLRDVLGFAALPEVTEELSNAASALIEVTYRRIRRDLESKYGTPRLEPSGDPCGFSILGLGKLGGRELNYSSDIDLMFLYEGQGHTDGVDAVSNKEFFKKVSNRLTEMLGTYTAEGMCYRIDLRLRPEGRLGEVCISLEGAQHYYQQRARDWELQMLIKASVPAGETGPGRALLEWVQPMIYSTTMDFSAVEAMSETRERINEKMNARRRSTAIDVKLSRGGIRDIEFLVQCLQRVHGGREAWLRNSSTLLALLRLRDKDLLSDAEYSRLAAAYQFLRHLEHRLQFADDRQTHALPENSHDVALMARRMPRGLMGDSPSPETLLQLLNAHFEHVQEIYERVIHAQQPVYYTQIPVVPAGAPDTSREELKAEGRELGASNLIRFLDQKAPNLASAAARAKLGKSQAAFEHFLERVVKHEDWLRALNGDSVLTGYLLDIFQHSPYFAEQLVRTPEYFEELRTMRARGPSTTAYGEVMPLFEDVHEIRRFFLRQMFRIQAESICLSTPIFSTLHRTSMLADAAIVACYRLAVQQTFAANPPSDPDYSPWQQMMVIALGRLGMHEFDLGSDADLIFVIPDDDLPHLHFWTRAAEKLMGFLSSYTGDGVMFAVDTRLCPNGRGGALVQSEGTYREYFAKQAEAWEGVAYMKTRAVAGDTERATKFLADLQRIDWRRYGQSGRSRKELRLMRLRIEKEHGGANPLKTAEGSYYDIDFMLMYLRLRGAGMFFKVLNTPERIEVVEQMGHLEPNDANFLRDAATFYRAVDHGLRLISGHTEGSLPASEAQLKILLGLVRRWLAEHLCDQPLELELAQIRHRTRDLFDKLFESE